VHSNGGRADLPASVSLSSPRLVVEPLYLDLQSENHAPATQAIRVSNRGVGRLEGTVASLVPWLRCSPGTFSCDTGVSAQIVVDVLLDDLRESTYSAAPAIRVESNGGSETVEATLHLVLKPVLHISTDDLDMRDEPRASFELANRGEGTLRVQVIPVEGWIVVNRRDWTVKGGKHADVRVWMENAPPGAQGEIEVRTSDETVRMTVHA
jgi:hypothetical protein